MAKSTVLILTFLLVGLGSMAQPYKFAGGLRLGYPTSLSLKYFNSEKTSFEGIIGYRGYSYYSWTNIALLISRYNKIESVEGLGWYVGGGAGVYVVSYDNTYSGTQGSAWFSLMGQIGLDYRFKDIPLNLSVDWTPTFFVNGISGFYGGYGGLSARYIFK